MYSLNALTSFAKHEINLLNFSSCIGDNIKMKMVEVVKDTYLVIIQTCDWWFKNYTFQEFKSLYSIYENTSFAFQVAYEYMCSIFTALYYSAANMNKWLKKWDSNIGICLIV